METGTSKVFAEMADAKPLGDAYPVLIIHTVAQAGIERPYRPEDFSSQKRCRLTNKADLAKAMKVKGLGVVALNDFPCRVYMIALAVEQPHVSVSLEVLRNLADRPW